MTKPLLSSTALASIRKIGEGQMQTEVRIYRASPLTVDSPSYTTAYDYGDDDDVEVEPYEGDAYRSALAWFYSTLQQQSSEDDAQIGTIDLHQIRLPWGTDVAPRDIIVRVDTGEEFIVIDTNAEDTWAEKLRVTVRRRE